MKVSLWLAAFTLLLTGCYKTGLMEEPPLEKTYWKLIELNGRKISNPDKNQTEIFLKMQKEAGDGLGNNGCNFIYGKYMIHGTNHIEIMITGQTLAFCPGLDLQNEFRESLEAAFTYTIKNRILELHDPTGVVLSEFLAIR